MDIATLAVKLIADATAYVKGLQDSRKQTQDWANGVSQQFKNVGGNMMNIGKQATTYMTLPILGAGLAAVNMASDYEETRNKVSVVFGDMSASVLEWSTNAATAMGQSQQQALEAAGTYGNLFVSLGLGQQPAADMSMELVQLASDLASFNNANPQDVLNALRSGLSGETEPLKRFGVAMNEAMMEQKAMELGMGDNVQALTEAQKLQVRYAIIMEQTATAQGDFARTSDGLANSQRIVVAQLKDAGATLGSQLLPYALKFAQWASDMVGRFQALTPEQQKMILIIAGIAAAIGPVITIVGGLVSAIGAIIPVVTAVAGVLTFPLIAIIAAVGAAVALLVVAWKNNWGDIQGKTQMAIQFVRNLIDQGMQFIHNLTSGKLGALSVIWNNSWNAIQTVVNLFVSNIRAVIAAFTAAIHGDWYAFGQQLRIIWDNNWKAIAMILTTAWNNIKTAISTLIKNAINVFKTTNWSEVGKNIVQGIANGITAAIDWAIAAIINLGQSVLDAIRGFLGIASPSKLMRLQIGIPIGQGIGEGMEQGIQALRSRVPGMLSGLAQPRLAFSQATVPSGTGSGGAGGVRLVNYGTLIIRTNGENVQQDILRQLQAA